MLLYKTNIREYWDSTAGAFLNKGTQYGDGSDLKYRSLGNDEGGIYGDEENDNLNDFEDLGDIENKSNPSPFKKPNENPNSSI